jgi:hypothetical protein
MESVEEIVYPFNSVIDFIAGNYGFNIQGYHLTIGWIALIFSSIVILRRKDSSYIKFTSIYFAGNIFSNFAYTLNGVRFSEFCGIIAAILYLKKSGVKTQKSPIAIALISTAIIASMQYLLVILFFQGIDTSIEERILRASLIAKILILGIVAAGFNEEFDNVESIKKLIKDIIWFANISIFIYILQFVLAVSGNTPYGTYMDAGFTGFFSFGSISMERGHYAKLFAPLFPFFLLNFLIDKNIIQIGAFLAINIINFSSSGQFFAATYIFLTLIILKKKVMKWYNLLSLTGVTILVIATMVSLFSKQFSGVIEKIFVLGVSGEEVGGRGSDVLFLYLTKYPLGTAYGGSSLRTIGGLPDVNSGIYAFITQFSVFALPLIIGFIVLNFKVVSNPNSFLSEDSIKALKIGMIASPIIYCADILWFTPTIWLPLIIYSSSTSKFSNRMRGYESTHSLIK